MGIQPDSVDAQLKKMIVGQAGVNPGAGLFSIAVNQGLYKKHGLDVEIIKTNTAAAVQAMLAGKMQMATGAGAAAFVTATLEGAPPFVLVASWVNVFPYKIMAQKSIQKVEDLKGKTGHVGAPFGTIPDTALRFALTRLKIDPDKDVKLVQHSDADPASILAAMEKGEVQFGILAPPFDLIAEKRGYDDAARAARLGNSLAAKRRAGAGFVSEKQPRQRPAPAAEQPPRRQSSISIRKKKPSRS